MVKIKRGDIYYVNLGNKIGSEQGGIRPVLVIQNDIGNNFSPTTIIACLTTSFQKAKIPTHVYINKCDTIEHKPRFVDSLVLCEQIRTIDKSRLMERVAVVKPEVMNRVDKALHTSIFHQ